MKINTIYNEDALKGLIKLEDNSIDCIITSPPYYQLRDYGHHGQIGKETYTGFNDRYTPPEDLMRNMRTVWTIPTQASEIEHFAMFPEELVERCIESGCKPKGIVLDMFSGSGTTCKVAKKLDRDYIGFEINPKYVELSNKRIKNQVRQVRLEL